MGMRTGIRGTTGEGENGRGELGYTMQIVSIYTTGVLVFVTIKQL